MFEEDVQSKSIHLRQTLARSYPGQKVTSKNVPGSRQCVHRLVNGKEQSLERIESPAEQESKRHNMKLGGSRRQSQDGAVRGH